MKLVQLMLAGVMMAGCAMKKAAPAEGGRYPEAMKQLAEAGTEEKRFYALNNAGTEAFKAGRLDEARAYAEEQAALLPKYKGDWNYGNAVHRTNTVLGRLALREGRMEAAEAYLLKSAETPGSPQLQSFGPSMALARELAEKGRRDVVINYLGLCAKFWKMEGGRLEKWGGALREGKTPDFLPNAGY
ncbi:MAG: RNA polymerase sigma-24 subunit ECF subfamily-like hypothetical protein [Elusimicrobia bacterium]|nr:MAG: RNA polymerase sigma-24 subunit ECF subfamily-like hypothetical protein [Elusimicrobiota bacterium]KAF0154810.1 MAG: RNA polymerase sigma-24 subunit ECF subfamily-like hypothetical protein [Elusimicrobiota bacterium]